MTKPKQNAQHRTLEYEEIYRYESLEDAQARVDYLIDKLYNRKRLRAALDYKPPVEFEQLISRVKTVA